MKDIFLNPGEYYFGEDGQLRTLLGSCVSVVMWHPRKRVGGMCHFVLPTRSSGHGSFDPRYGDEAIFLMLGHIKELGARPKEFEVRLYGGGDMFPSIEASEGKKIGINNVKMAKAMLGQYGFTVVEEDTGGHYHRRISFNTRSGKLEVKRELVQATT